MSKTTVIYHSADFDGIFCREIARKFLPEAELIGWDFGDPLLFSPDYGQIYVLDLPIDQVFGIAAYELGKNWKGDGRTIWIDHHKSSIESHPKSIPGYRIDGVAACRLAWQWFTADSNKHLLPETRNPYFNRIVVEPLAVRMAGEYDIWDKRDPDAELFQHGLQSEPVDFQKLLSKSRSEIDPQFRDVLRSADDYVERLLNQGRVIQYARTQENASIIEELGFTFKWEGMTWLACNHARYNSHLFTAALRPEHDACFGFKFTGHVAGGKPCEQWSVSLYHAPGKEHHDLSTIAVKHGGGGHRGACGFQTDKLPFL